jgi:hypothetical protein
LLGLILLGAAQGFASSDLDRKFALETIGYLRAADNVDGLFSEYVASAYKDYFAKQTRFIPMDLSQGDAVLSRSKIPYQKLIQDPDILGQLVRSTRTESILRTQIFKEGSRYSFTLDWLYAPHMEKIASVQFSLEDQGEGARFGSDFITQPLHDNLDQLFSTVPFQGQVTGRDQNSVTVSLGGKKKVKPGDILIIATLDEVKRHPLLKTIVDWKLNPTGKLKVEQVDDAMTFCKVIEEEEGRGIARYQKIIQVQSGATFPVAVPLSSEHPSESSPIRQESEGDSPKLGWFAASMPVGSYSRQNNDPTVPVTLSGGGLALGGKGEGQIWLTRQWFAELALGYSFWSLSQHSSQTGVDTPVSQNGGVSGSLFTMRLGFGYSYLLTGNVLGPKGWIKAGYKSSSYNLPVDTSELTGPTSVTSFYMGLGGELPIQKKFGLQANFNFRLLSSASQQGLNSDTSGSSDVDFFVGGYYWLSKKLSVRGGLEINATNIDLENAGSLSQKTVTIAPALLYYF